MVTIPRGAAFSPLTNAITKPSHFGGGGLDPGPADRYALKIDSPTAVRTLNRLLADGASAEIALGSFTTPEGETLPAGSAIFAGDPSTATMLAATARDAELRFKRVRTGNLPSLEPIEAVPRIAVLVAAVDQNVWTLRNLGFTVDPVSVGTINSAPTDPLLELRPRLQHRQLALGRQSGREGAG